MRAKIIDLGAAFEIQPELQPDGSSAPPAKVTMKLQPCWQKPPVEVCLAYLYTHEEIAYYAKVKLEVPNG